MERVHLGCVKYLNTLPLVQGLDRWLDARITAAAPSRLFDMLTGEPGGPDPSARVDLALASVVDAACHAERVTLLARAGIIGCDGPTRTVRLYSRVPFGRARTLHADTESHTSVVLARLILERRFSARPESAEFTPAPPGGERGHADWPETVLLIGDKVETLAPSEREFPHQLDLGLAWKELTGLPFVYAAWMCRRGEERAERIRAAASVLERARLHNRTRLDWIVQSESSARAWDPAHAAEYLGGLLRYEAGPREREAASTFVSMARESGLLPPGPELYWEASGGPDSTGARAAEPHAGAVRA